MSEPKQILAVDEQKATLDFLSSVLPLAGGDGVEIRRALSAEEGLLELRRRPFDLLIAGVRLAAGRALVAAVIAEFMVSIDGLGFYILFNTRTFHHNEAFVGVLVLCLFGVGFDGLMTWLMRKYLPWFRRPAE